MPVSFSCFLKPFSARESILLSSGNPILWDTNCFIPYWYQSWYPNQILDEGPSFFCGMAQTSSQLLQSVLNALPLLIFTIILSGGFNYLNGYRSVNWDSRKWVTFPKTDGKWKTCLKNSNSALLLLYSSTCDTFSRYGLVKCLYFKSNLKLMTYYRRLAKISSLTENSAKTKDLYLK